MSEPNRIRYARTSSEAAIRSQADSLWSYYSAVLGLGVLLLLLAIPVAQDAQAGGGGSLIGIASDAADTHAGIGSLEVTLADAEGRRRTTSTDERGRFEFLDLDPGNHMLLVRGAGYQEARDPQVHIRKGRSTTIRLLVAKGSTVRVLEDADDTFSRVARPLPLADRP